MSGVHAENLPLVNGDGLSVTSCEISGGVFNSKNPLTVLTTVSIVYLLNKILIDYVELV